MIKVEWSKKVEAAVFPDRPGFKVCTVYFNGSNDKSVELQKWSDAEERWKYVRQVDLVRGKGGYSPSPLAQKRACLKNARQVAQAYPEWLQ